MAEKSSSFAQRSATRIRFDNADMDYYLSWIMGREIYDGSRLVECMEVAERITDGDTTSWRAEWTELAYRVEQEALKALEAGDRDAARSAFLRACSYHRAPLFLMPPTDEEFRPRAQRMRECFESATALFDPPIERVEIPFGEHRLPGYLWKPDAESKPRPTLIVFGGIETFAEDCYFMVGPEGARQGYTMLTVDLPGQGFLPDEGLYFGAEMEEPVAAVVDWALACADVDPERLAVFGFSWGGHIVFKAAQYESRVKATIANPAMPDVFRSVLGQQQGVDRKDPIARRMGKAYDYYFHGKTDARQIISPVLLLAGEDEAPVTLKIARETHDLLPNMHSKLVVFTREQGGAAHCQVDNLALPNGVIFSWLAEVLA